jgi:hypothetical protein
VRWWLSFADPERPAGQQFLGVAIVEAPDFIYAARLAKTVGCNPGGEVRGWEVPQEAPELPMNRLLSRQEMEDLGLEPVTLEDLEAEGVEVEDGGCVLCEGCHREHGSGDA